MENKKRETILVHRKIEETGINLNGQHIFINSTTLHKFDEIEEEGWGLLANFEDAIKLTVRGKSLKVLCLKHNILMISTYRLICSLWLRNSLKVSCSVSMIGQHHTEMTMANGNFKHHLVPPILYSF